MKKYSILTIIVVICSIAPVNSWFDKTHIAVVQACNVQYSPCLAIAPDVVSHKYPVEAANHFSSAANVSVSFNYVLKQVVRYDKDDSKGHLYGAIIASARQVYKNMKNQVRPDYDYAFLAHYVGDLSQPLHNSPYDLFNKKNHKRIDGLVDDIPNLAELIFLRMGKLRICTDAEIVVAVADLANKARAADKILRNHEFSQSDALNLLGRSATLLNAIDIYLRLSLNILEVS